MTMTRHILPLVSLLILFSLALSACRLPFPGQSQSSQGQFALSADAQQVALTDQDGNPFRMSELQGKITMLFFGYANCPDVCPATLATWKQVENKLGDQAEQVSFVFVTVDPERDTPERLKKHVRLFSDNFIALTGNYDELLPIYQAYNVYHERAEESDSAAGYLVSHTASSFLLDKEGTSQTRFKFGTTTDEMVEAVRGYLQ